MLGMATHTRLAQRVATLGAVGPQLKFVKGGLAEHSAHMSTSPNGPWQRPGGRLYLALPSRSRIPEGGRKSGGRMEVKREGRSDICDEIGAPGPPHSIEAGAHK